jgi:hypothetical protein
MIFKHLPVGSARFETLFLTMTAALTATVENTVNDTHSMTLPAGASATKPTYVSIGPRVSDEQEEMINQINENLTFVADEGHSRMPTKMSCFLEHQLNFRGPSPLAPPTHPIPH